ncbi:hypothetical protein LCGC14_0231240 [marine sediment metagenome]|uniref:Uncharacterized protein n=1 Tax=marine sediment metagenome TaxID=412755 RepID=A0A0F9UR88_9ZZZZ
MNKLYSELWEADWTALTYFIGGVIAAAVVIICLLIIINLLALRHIRKG